MATNRNGKPIVLNGVGSLVLKQVRDVATSVESASQDVNRYALSVNALAQSEQAEAEETATQLESMLQRLDDIAVSAQQANQVADTTSSTTRHAQHKHLRRLQLAHYRKNRHCNHRPQTQFRPCGNCGMKFKPMQKKMEKYV